MKTICKFSKNMLLKLKKSKQRIVKGYKISVFDGYHLERYFMKIVCIFAKKFPIKY